MNIKDLYKTKILKIWSDFNGLRELNETDCEYRKFPIAPKTIKENSILFIGINPSFSKKKTLSDISSKIEFYPEIDENKKNIQYFEKMKDIAKYSKMNWTHLDLLFLRETNQKIIETMMKHKKGIEFISEQLSISFEIIEKSNPKIIVVANSLASEFFGKKKKKHHSFKSIWKGYKLDFDKDFDKKIGTYKIILNEKEVPIIFSSMLSGQRALDIGSLERLKWQIKMLIKSKR